VGVLVAGEGRELLDPGLDVVPCHPLPGFDRRQVDGVDDGAVVVDGLGGDPDAQVALRLHHRNPQLAF
jgi:hypothetical protein